VKNKTDAHIVIIGAGPGGIYAGIRLLERGITDFTIYERADDVGGTWWKNRYPGNACDVPALNYSFTIRPNIEATHTYEGGKQLHRYFRGLAEEFGVLEHVIFNTEMATADWDGSRWHLMTTGGEPIVADIVITAVGRLHRARYPDIAGLNDFRGTVVHSSEWDESFELDGRIRLGVIGSGSSAVQIVSEASKTVAEMVMFNRTPQWILPIENEEIPEEIRQRYRDDPEFVAKSFDDLEEWLNEIAGAIFVGTDEAAERKQRCLDALATVSSGELRAKLTPDHEVGCKRLIMSGDFFEAVQRPNVTVVRENIDRIVPEGVVTKDGALHELDVLILATGFHADGFLRPMQITGEGGTTLDDIWKDKFLNYKSVALPHMPNLFTINGPFSPGGSVSLLMIIESHVDYILQLVDRIMEEKVCIQPDEARSDELLEEVRERTKKTVWYTGGCTSWYLDKEGVPIVTPMTPAQLRADMTQPQYEDFIVKNLVPA